MVFFKNCSVFSITIFLYYKFCKENAYDFGNLIYDLISLGTNGMASAL
jgi:hypothetical protein